MRKAHRVVLRDQELACEQNAESLPCLFVLRSSFVLTGGLSVGDESEKCSRGL